MQCDCEGAVCWPQDICLPDILLQWVRGTCHGGSCRGEDWSVGVIRMRHCHLRAGFQQCKSFVEMCTVRCCPLWHPLHSPMGTVSWVLVRRTASPTHTDFVGLSSGAATERECALGLLLCHIPRHWGWSSTSGKNSQFFHTLGMKLEIFKVNVFPYPKGIFSYLKKSFSYPQICFHTLKMFFIPCKFFSYLYTKISYLMKIVSHQ
jgi:hypothetical protein